METAHLTTGSYSFYLLRAAPPEPVAPNRETLVPRDTSTRSLTIISTLGHADSAWLGLHTHMHVLANLTRCMRSEVMSWRTIEPRASKRTMPGSTHAIHIHITICHEARLQCRHNIGLEKPAWQRSSGDRTLHPRHGSSSALRDRRWSFVRRSW